MALQNDLTTGSVPRHIVRFAFPLIVSNVFQALYNAVDMFFVGRYTGTAGLSAVSVSGPLMNIMLMTISGLSVGVMVAVARHAGQSDDGDGVARFANSAIGFYAVISVIVTILGCVLTPAILRLVNTPEEAMPHAVPYLRTIFAGIVFMFGYNLICAFQRGLGDSKSSMYFVIAAALINVVLDYLFLRWFSLGAFGAALATVISQAFSFIMGVIYFRVKGHVITFSPREIRLKAAYIRELLQTGLPTAGNQFLLSISLSTLSGIANSFGLYASAAYGIGVKIDSFALLPSDAVNVAVSSFASQNLGAGLPDRVERGLREALKIAFSIAAVVAVLVFLFAPQLASIFNSDSRVLDYAVLYLRIDCLSYFFFAATHCLTGFIRGTGNAVYTVYNVVLAQYVVRIPSAILLTRLIGFAGVPIAMTIAPAFSMMNYAMFIFSGRWKKRAGVAGPKQGGDSK